MEARRGSLEGIVLIEPRVFEDERGFFMETFHRERYRSLGVAPDFLQDNVSGSRRGTLRGLHYQHPKGQAKLVQVLEGEVYDVVVDIRRGSPDFGRWMGVTLSGANKRQLYIPKGFAHGFCVLTDWALFSYKCGPYYSPENERGILWSDPAINIQWPLRSPALSEKDKKLPSLADTPADRLPVYRNKR